MPKHNKEKIKELIEALRAHTLAKEGLVRILQGPMVQRIGFNMAEWFAPVETPSTYTAGTIDHVDSCDTIACLAGWVCILNKVDIDNENARAILGLGTQEASDLFCPATPFGLKNLTPWQAIRTLEILYNEGEVDWDRAIDELRAETQPVA